MTLWYVDTSAAMRLLSSGPERLTLQKEIRSADARLVSSWLLETELRRAAQQPPQADQAEITDYLETIDLAELTGDIYRKAGLLPGPTLRSLDAIHLAAAIELRADRLVTYDRQQRRAARAVGLPTVPES